jgi:hypothetical protein
MRQAQKHFARVVELARDKGAIGSILRRREGWVLQEADRWAEQDFESQKKHNDPNRLPFPDPWRHLSMMPVFSDYEKAVFRAAQSQLVALRHLGRMRLGIATLNTDWQQEAMRARVTRDTERANDAAERVANGLWQFGPVIETIRNYANDRPDLRDNARLWQKRRRAQLVHHGQWDDTETPKQWPPYGKFQAQHRLETLLVEWWVRQGVNGAPGFMFWRNEAMTKFLQTFFSLPATALPPAETKKVRQRLGLVPVSKDNHFVWNMSVEISNGTRTVKGAQRNGAFAFEGDIPSH